MLSSIDNQVGVDFDRDIEVLIVNDHSDVILSEKFLHSFANISPDYLQTSENSGSGIARQTGIDKAIGEYILCCDADDVLHSVGVLGLFLGKVKKTHMDVYSSDWLEEVKDRESGRYIYIEHKIDATWFHGKLFRRKFLVENNLKLIPKFRVHEDTYFVSNAMELARGKIEHISLVTYVWKYNEKSITRRNDAQYEFTELDVFIESVFDSVTWLRGKISTTKFKVTQAVLYVFNMLQNKEFEKYKLCKEKAVRKLRERLVEFRGEIFGEETDEFYEIYVAERKKHHMTKIEVSFREFIAGILSEGSEK
jgi:glycosyltransferase involved in cell wall biosynthesis